MTFRSLGSWLHRNSVSNRRNWEVWLYILTQLSIHTTDRFKADSVVWYKILCGIPEEKDWLSFFELQWPYVEGGPRWSLCGPIPHPIFANFEFISMVLIFTYKNIIRISTLTFILVAWWKENLMKWQLRFNLNLILKTEPF
jgi:hypothetical protein